MYRVPIPSLAPGASATVDVEVVFFQSIVPFPVQISQDDKQLVKYGGNSYFYSPYVCATQTSIFTLPTADIVSFSKVSPTSSADDTVTYGPYVDKEPSSYGRIDLHYENNNPFLKVVELERIIEVSHWGNIAVEEHVHIKHIGESLLLLLLPSHRRIRWMDR